MKWTIEIEDDSTNDAMAAIVTRDGEEVGHYSFGDMNMQPEAALALIACIVAHDAKAKLAEYGIILAPDFL